MNYFNDLARKDMSKTIRYLTANRLKYAQYSQFVGVQFTHVWAKEIALNIWALWLLEGFRFPHYHYTINTITVIFDELLPIKSHS